MLNVALVGCGTAAANYRRSYSSVPGVRVRACIDTNELAARDCAEALDAPRWGVDFTLALGPDVDMVDISTPNHLHMEQAIAALEADKHTLIQKPLAPSVSEAEAILRAAQASRAKAGMLMSMRGNPVFVDLKSMVENGALGEVCHVYCRGARADGLSMQPGTWRQDRDKTGGGAFVQKTIHFIDLAEWILQEPIVRICGFSANRMSPSVGGDDTSAGACAFSSGTVGTLEGSYASGPHAFAVYGTRGFVSVLDNRSIQVKLDVGFDGDVIHYETPGVLRVFQPETSEVMTPALVERYDQRAAFIRSVRDGTTIPVPLEVGVHEMRVVEAFYRSCESGVVEELAY